MQNIRLCNTKNNIQQTLFLIEHSSFWDVTTMLTDK